MLDLARAQVRQGHAVGLVCAPPEAGCEPERVLAAMEPQLALGIARVPMPRGPHPADLRPLLRMSRICRAARPDVVHGHGAKGGLYARLALWPESGRPAIRAYTPHGGSFHFAPGSLRHDLYMTPERLMAARTDLFLFESAYVAGRFEAAIGAVGGIVRINHNGIGPAEFEPIMHAADAHDLVMVGELRDLKGVDTLIDAMALLRGRGCGPGCSSSDRVRTGMPWWAAPATGASRAR